MTILIEDCLLLTPPPTGYAARIADEAAYCGYCQELIYPQLSVLRAHDFNWDGSRMTWYSREFQVFVHKCAEHAREEDVVEVVQVTGR